MLKMSQIRIIVISIVLLGGFACDKSGTDPDNNDDINTQTLTGAYFGETLPSTTVSRFAPDVFSEEFHAPPIFSPDGSEVYWNLMSSPDRNIQFMEMIDGVWSTPTAAPFSHNEGSDSPFLSSDGNTAVFLSARNAVNNENIWIVEKIDGEWGNAQMLGNEVNQFGPHWQASIADNQNLYFGAHEVIYFSEYVGGNYTTAQPLGPAINTDTGYEGSPFIAPDESYLIFDRVVDDGTYDADLYISFKQNDGSWGVAVEMAALNTGAHELYANVSPDGLFIMLLSGRTGILLPHWVDASIIDNYRN